MDRFWTPVRKQMREEGERGREDEERMGGERHMRKPLVVDNLTSYQQLPPCQVRCSSSSVGEQKLELHSHSSLHEVFVV
jgi:hypothetical protein